MQVRDEHRLDDHLDLPLRVRLHLGQAQARDALVDDHRRPHLEDGAVETFLVAEVIVDEGDGDIGAQRDLAHRGAVEAVVGKLALRGHQDAHARGRAIALRRLDHHDLPVFRVLFAFRHVPPIAQGAPMAPL